MRLKKRTLTLIIVINVIWITVMGVVLLSYVSNNQQQTYERNRSAFEQATSEIAITIRLYFEGRQELVADMIHYLTTMDGGTATAEAAAAVLQHFVTGDSSSFQLVDCATQKGLAFLPDKEPISVSYAPRSSGQINFPTVYGACQEYVAGTARTEGLRVIPEFTNPATGIQSLAFHNSLTLLDASGAPAQYALMCVVRKSALVGSGLPLAPYADAASAVISAEGDYVVKTNQFKSVNLFEYLYGYNRDALARVEALKAALPNATGTFRMPDHTGEERLFAYTPLPGTDGWSYVASVPIASFKQSSIDLTLAILLSACILMMALFDGIVMLTLTRRLKASLGETSLSMQAAEKANSAKSEFLSRMSHDMRTPMNGIIGFVNLALEEQPSPAVRDCLLKIQRSGGFLLALINDTLDMSKIESRKMTLNLSPVPCSQLLGDAMDTIRPIAESKAVRLVNDAENCDHMLLMDRVRVQQVLTNILSNAAKFTPTNGEIAMRSRCMLGNDGRYRLHVQISDTGCGMSADFLPTLFEPFSQADSSQSGGTGLGMSIVKNLMELMNGTIDVQSEPGKGTTITIEAAFAAAEADTAEKHVEIQSIEGCHLLLCEDNDINAEIVRRQLIKRGCTVDRTANGQQGLDLFAASAPGEYDAVIMDLRMPVMNGLDATRGIRALKREDAESVPIIAMTANAFDEDRVQALASGMNAFLTKPLEPKLLYVTVAEQISARRQGC